MRERWLTFNGPFRGTATDEEALASKVMAIMAEAGVDPVGCQSEPWQVGDRDLTPAEIARINEAYELAVAQEASELHSVLWRVLAEFEAGRLDSDRFFAEVDRLGRECAGRRLDLWARNLTDLGAPPE